MTLLSHIIAVKQEEIAARKSRVPLGWLREQIEDLKQPVRPFADALRTNAGPHIIAEVKRASPSKGVLRPDLPVADWRPGDLARAYAMGGASCISVLTDTTFFWGSPDYLATCREAVPLPLLRKDFVVEPYQVLESRWLGADAVLLMASILDPKAMDTCAALAFGIGLTVLFEVHGDDELNDVLAIDHQAGQSLIGINHRNLHTMQMDMQRALRLRDRIPAQHTVVAESGLLCAEDLAPLRAVGIDAFLIGGHLAASDHPAADLKKLRGQ